MYLLVAKTMQTAFANKEHIYADPTHYLNLSYDGLWTVCVTEECRSQLSLFMPLYLCCNQRLSLSFPLMSCNLMFSFALCSQSVLNS